MQVSEQRAAGADAAWRAQLARALTWEDAHATFEKVVGDFPAELRGVQAPGLPYTAWQLLEHMRLTQHDVLDFCRNADYQEPNFPADYWPMTTSPPDPAAWDESVAGYQRERAEFVRMAEDHTLDLNAAIPHGTGQTYLREVVLMIDHNSYHMGQLVLLRRLLGAWTAS
jgi:hypothetical protein